MKPIKITAQNRHAIEAALAEANGRAKTHTFDTIYEIHREAIKAESQLDSLSVPQKSRVGAIWSATSGGPVSNSYAKKSTTRAATRVTLERRATGWFLTSAIGATIYQQGGSAGLTITPEQESIALAKFRESFRVAAAA